MGTVGYVVKLSMFSCPAPAPTVQMRVFRACAASRLWFSVLKRGDSPVHIPINNILVGAA